MVNDRSTNGPGSRGWAQPVASQDLVVIAASAGGLHALGEVLSSLPADFPAAIAVVQHRGEEHPEILPELLQLRTALRVRHARSGDLLEPRTVYVCPPGMHMTAEHCLRLVEGPKLDHVRPSADLMLGSAARTHGERAIGVVLSGCGSDGAVGCAAIFDAGGMVIAQDPASCAYASMPTAVIERGRADLVLPPAQIGKALQQLVTSNEDERRSGAAGAEGHRRAPRAPLTTVLLADDHRIILDGLRALLQAQPDLRVIAEAEEGRTAVLLAGELSPDVVVMDISMPDVDGIDATRQIKEKNPRTGVVALSAYADARSADRILKAGATGYVCKNAAFSELATAVRSVAAGQRYLSPRIAEIVAAISEPWAAAGA